jgi:hypothetical protein
MDPLAKRKMWHVLSKLTTRPKVIAISVAATAVTVHYETVTCVTASCVTVILVTAMKLADSGV